MAEYDSFDVVYSLAMGVGMLVLAILIPLLTVICVGIPVALLLILAGAVAGLFGWVAMGIGVGEQLLATLHTVAAHPLAAAVIGAPVISVLTGIPCLGWLLGLVVLAAGLGAVVLTRFGTLPYPAPATPASPAPTAPAGPTPSPPAADGPSTQEGQI